MSEMTFIEYTEIKNRMTRGYSYYCKISCRDCPLSPDNNGMRMCCRDLERKYPEKALAIVEKWREENDNAPAIYRDVISSLKIIIADYIERGEYENAKDSLNNLADWEARKEEMLNEIRKGAGYLALNLPLFYSLVDDDMF